MNAFRGVSAVSSFCARLSLPASLSLPLSVGVGLICPSPPPPSLLPPLLFIPLPPLYLPPACIWVPLTACARRTVSSRAGEKVADRPDWQSRIIPDHDELKTDPDAPSLIVVDGHNIIFRSFHALPHLTAADGTPVGAVVGFCSIMNRLVSAFCRVGSRVTRVGYHIKGTWKLGL